MFGVISTIKSGDVGALQLFGFHHCPVNVTEPRMGLNLFCICLGASKSLVLVFDMEFCKEVFEIFTELCVLWEFEFCVYRYCSLEIRRIRNFKILDLLIILWYSSFLF